MSEVRPTGSPRLRVVRSDESPPPRRRPGPAVLAVAIYGILFAIALGYLRAGGPRPHAPGSPPPGGGPPSATARAHDRAFLLSGAGLTGAARSRFDRRLNEERCDCGCGLTLHDCLARDLSCSRSPERAAAAAAELR